MFKVVAMVCGYHVYKDVWEACVGVSLRCKFEPGGNPHDPYAVSVLKGETIVGHLPRFVSSICCMFLHRGGAISAGSSVIQLIYLKVG